MIAIIKKAWKNTTDFAQKNWTKITLGGIFSVSLATFTAVFPPAFLPVFFTLATLAVGSALYFVGKAIVSFFKTETAPAITTTAADTKANVKGSTAQVTSTLNANPAAATANAEATATVTSTASAKPTTAAANEEDNENDAAASRSMSM